MKKVITYGTYDRLHYGHIKLLERAKSLGDYLIVGVTADDFDLRRGKINVQQPLMERVEAVRQTGLADEIIVEEYDGQKIDDIKRLQADIFTVGSDWAGTFDYLKEYCEVVYLDRTQGVSSSEIRAKENQLHIGIIGEPESVISKFINESSYVNGIVISGLCTANPDEFKSIGIPVMDIDRLMDVSDAVYVVSHPRNHYNHIKTALLQGKHVLCESPLALSKKECLELYEIADKHHLVLSEAIKTAYSTAYSRMILLAKGGIIGNVVSVDAICTSLRHYDFSATSKPANYWNSITSWGPTALLPVFQLLGTDYSKKEIISKKMSGISEYDLFTKITFIYPHAVASIKVGKGVKSEGELIISGTDGYIYVPAPWWKTDYFEVRKENPADNKRYFYQLDGEGIRLEIASFLRSIERQNPSQISSLLSSNISAIMEDYTRGIDCYDISSNN